MGSKDLAVLRKILRHIESIMRYCADCRTLEDFSSDAMRLEATVFNLMQIGELAKESLSDEAKAQIKTIPWQQIYGMRNRIVHGYWLFRGQYANRVGHRIGRHSHAS